MKTMKKLASAALALVMALSLAVPAFAAGEGKITITNAEPEQTYNLYKIFDLTYGGTENEDETAPHTYTVNADWADFIAQTTVKGVYVDVDDQGYVTWHKDGEGKDADVAAFAAQALAWAKEKGLTPVKTLTTAPVPESVPEAEKATYTTQESFTELELGYYLVSSTLGSLCALDTTNKEVAITEKNEKPTDSKQADPVEGNEPKVGDDKYYTITINAKKGAKAYVAHDTMSASLTFKPSTLTVTATPVVAEGETAETTTLTKDTHYTLVETPADGCTFEVVFDQEYLDTLEGDTTIKINYAGTINTNAVTGTDPITNKEILSYGDGNKTEETPGNKTEDDLYEFDLVKVNSNKEVLSGAEFELYASDEEGAQPLSLVLVEDAQGDYYRPAVEGETGSTVIAAGVATVKGLGEGTYYLKETKQPEGYNLLQGYTAVTVGKDVKDAEGKDFVPNATVETTTEGEVTKSVYVAGGVAIVNLTGAELPSTGGIGTTLFYIAGAVLVAGAGILLITKKRMGAEEE